MGKGVGEGVVSPTRGEWAESVGEKKKERKKERKE